MSFKEFDKFFVGFDKVADKLTKITEQSVKLAQNYPPFNIKKLDNDKYSIEIAVAGFATQDIDIEMVGDTLYVKGSISADKKDLGAIFPSYLWKGVSDKAFTREFALADNIEVKGAELINGMLKIWLESLTPEKTLGKKIQVKEGKASA